MCCSQGMVLLSSKVGSIMAHKVTWLAVDDWAAIYVDGILIGEQSHSLSPWTIIEVFEALGAEVEDLRYDSVSEDIVEELGRFPETWTHV